MLRAVLLLFLIQLLSGPRVRSEGALDQDDLFSPGGSDEDVETTYARRPLTRIKSVAEFETYINPPDVIFAGGVIGVFPTVNDELKEFEQFAMPLDGHGFRFALCIGEKSLLDYFSVKDKPKIFVYPPPLFVSEVHGDKKRFRFGGTDLVSDSGKAALKAFILEHYLPLASQISPIVGNERIFVERRLPVFVVISRFDYDADPKGMVYMLNRLRKIGDKYTKRMTFAILDKEDAESTLHFRKEFFVADEETRKNSERIVGIKDARSYYTLTSGFSVENAVQFIEDFFNKRLEPSSHQNDLVDPIMDGDDYNHMDL